MLGAMVYVMGDAGRIERLSGGLCRPDDEDGGSPAHGRLPDRGHALRRAADRQSTKASNQKRPKGGKTCMRLVTYHKGDGGAARGRAD